MTTSAPKYPAGSALAKLAALVERKKLEASAASSVADPSPVPATTSATTTTTATTATATQLPGMSGNGTLIEWNAEQRQAIDYAQNGREFCLIGAAGTGKTTTTKQIVRELIAANIPLVKNGTRYLRTGLPGIVLVSFTNRAVRNLAKALHDVPELLPHCLTIHKLLEYGPEYYEELDVDTGVYRKKMRFTPARGAMNPIMDVRLCIVDESSMVDTALFAKLRDALPNAKFLFLGDLNQLPPVFGDATLGFKLAEIPVVELTRVYRQAMESPIIGFQHNFVLKGFPCSDNDLEKITAEAKGLSFRRIKKNLIDGKRSPEDRAMANEQMCAVFGKYFEAEFDAGRYVPGEDIILMPFNKAFGTIEMNRHIAQFVGAKSSAVVHEIISGMETHYFAEGDYVVFDKQEWLITSIETNPKYFGKKQPQVASPNLDRWGALHGGKSLAQELEALGQTTSSSRLESMLDAVGSGIDAEDIERAASHIIHLRNASDPDHTRELETTGELNALSFGYAITIHKSQGSEWRKVFLFMCKQHAVMLSRELLYTGMTRAREELVVFYDGSTAVGKKDNTIARAIKKQDIPGKTWRDKLPYFRGKWDAYQTTMDGGLFSGELPQIDLFGNSDEATVAPTDEVWKS